MSGYQEPPGGTSSPSTGTAVGSKPIRAVLRLFRGVNISAESEYGASFIPALDSPFSITANNLRLNNPAKTFYTSFESPAITINQVIKIPTITTVESGARKDEVILTKQSQELKNKGIDINPSSTDENIIYDDDADTSHMATFDVNGKLVKSLISSLPLAAPADNSVTDAKIATHTSTKITITNKAQLPSTAVYNDQANTFATGVMQSFRTGQIRLFDTNASHAITLTTGDQTTNVNAIFPVLGASDTFTFLNQAQILTQKEIDTVQNVLKNLGSHNIDVFFNSADSLWKARNRTTGVITSSNSSLTTVLQAAINGLTAARTNIESVKVWGVGTHDKITLPSYTRLDLTDAKLTFIAHASLTSSDHQFTNSDHTNGNTQIQVIGGFIDGNRTNQPPYNSVPPASEAAANTFHLVKCTDSFIVTSNISNTPARAVAFYDCVNCYAAYNTLKTINAEGIQFHQGSRNKMLYNDASNLRQSFYTTHESPDGIIHGNYGDTITASTSGMNNSSMRTIVTNNVIKNTQLAVFTMSEGSASHEGSGSIIAENAFSGSATGEGISIVSVTQTGLIIANNHVYGNAAQGIRISGIKNGIIFEGNNVHDNALSGISVQSGAGGLLPINVSIKGNFCWNNGTALGTDVQRAGISINGAASPDEPANVWIEGNHCYDTRSGGSKTQKYGIYSSNSLNSVISNNNVRDNSTDGIALVNSNTGLRIFENPGYSANTPIATTTGTETFTNKTLTSPTINSGTLSGTFTLPNVALTGITLANPSIAGAAEKWLTFLIQGNTLDKVTVENATANDANGFLPTFIFDHGTTTSPAGIFIGRGATDTGTNGLFRIDGRIGSSAPTTRPIFDIAPVAVQEYAFFTDRFDMKGNNLVNAVITSTVTGVTDANIASHTSTKITITAKAQLNSQIAYKDETTWLTTAMITDANVTGAKIASDTITDTNVKSDAAIAWGKLSKTGSILDDIADVVITSPQEGDVPTWDADTSTWINAPPPGAASGEANTTSNEGTGEGTLALPKSGVNLPFKTLKQGSAIAITNNANDVTLAVSGVADANISAHTSTKITITNKAQLPSDVMYTGDSQTITNKTHTSPVINSATLTGTITLPSGNTTFLTFSKPATAGPANQEQFMKWVLSDDANSYVMLQNATGTENVFVPQMVFRNLSNNNAGGIFQGETDATNDNGTTPVFVIDGRRTTAALGSTRPIFGLRSFAVDEYTFGMTSSDWKGNNMTGMGDLTFNDAKNIVVNATTGTKIGTATTQKIGFLNATPVSQQTGGATTAGATYTATEQGMLQKAYDCLRSFGFLS